MNKLAILFLILAVPTLADSIPNHAKTPGALNPNVTQENIDSTICISGWTKTIRPPVRFTNDLKIKQIKSLGLPGDPKDYEEDHLVPLELGGAPFDPKNLWPEPWGDVDGAHEKDKVENKLHRMVCKRKISLSEAQQIFLTDWRKGKNL